MNRPFYIQKIKGKEDDSMSKLSKYKLCGNLDVAVTAKMLYLILLEITDEDNKVIIPQRRVSETLGISKGTVSRNLRKLRDRGYIEISPQFHSDGGRAANQYRIL
jgi:DNA-binding MarR family transcriptional regulator